MHAVLLAALVTLGAGSPAVAAPDRGAHPADAPALWPAQAVRDTVVEIARDEGIVVENGDANVFVDTWERAAVRVEAVDDERSRIVVNRGAGGIRIGSRDRKGRPAAKELRVTLPPWVALEVRGAEGDVEVTGVAGGVAVRTLDGEVRLRDVGGGVRVRSVQGEVRIDGVEGDVEVRGSDGDVRVTAARGSSVVAQTVDGDVILDGIDASRVTAGSVDGDITFRGPVREGGTYSLTTHDGDVIAAVSGPLDARVSVSTYDGRFDSDFPVVLERFRGGEVLRFTLGDGSAELRLEAFDGEIRLERAR